MAVDTGFIVYNERDLPAFVGLLDELGVETQAERHVVRLDLSGLRLRVQLARRPRAPSRPADRSPGPATGGCWPTSRASTARRAPCSTDPMPTTATLGDCLDDRRFGRPFRDHFLVPITSAVWSTAAGPDRGLPGRLPAALPRQPRAHRLRQWRPVADDLRRLAAPMSTASSRALPAGLGPRRRPRCSTFARDRGRRDDPDRRTARAERFDAVIMATHADDALDLLRDAESARATRARRLRVLDQRGRAPHRRARSCPPTPRARASWNVGPGRLPPPGRRADDDLPHEPAAVAARAESTTACRSTRATASDPSAVLVERAMSHPIYTFRTLEAQAGCRALQGRRSTWFAGAHLGYGFHEDGCRSGFEAADDGPRRVAGGGRMRSHLLEGIVRHRRVRPFAYALEHDVFYARPRPRRARRARRAGSAVQPRPPEPAARSATRDHLRPPADDLARRSAPTCAPDGDDPTGWRVTLVTNLRVLGYVFNPASFYLCRDRRGDLRAVIVEVHNTLRRTAPLHASAAREDADADPFAARWTRRSSSRRSSRTPAATPSTSGTSPTACASRSRCARPVEPLLSTSLDLLRRVPLTDRIAAADARAPSVRDPHDDRTDPLARRAAVAARRPVLPPWCGGSAPVTLAAQRARETIR